MPPRLPRYLAFEEKARDLERIAKILLEVGDAPPEANGGKPLRSSADGHRDDRRRGLPMIGRGVSGAIRGSDPLGEAIRRDEARQRRR